METYVYLLHNIRYAYKKINEIIPDSSHRPCYWYNQLVKK